MSDYARLNLGKGYNGGTQVTVYGDSYQDLVNTLTPVYGTDQATEIVNGAFLKLASEVGTATQGATENLQAAGVVAAPPVSTVGQALPPVAPPVAPPAVTVPPVVPQAGPPTLQSPGNCAHGARVYKTQQTARGMWNRWECAIPWQKGLQGRCEPINA